jgi:capsular polysaccharide biosynthesis protein
MQSNDQAGARRSDNDIDWNFKMSKKEYHETHGSMNTHTLSTEFTLQEACTIIRELRENVARHEQLLERIATFLQLPAIPPPAWMPSRVMRSVIEHSTSAIKVTKIQSPDRDDVVTELHNTWLGRIYRTHMKHYSAVRWLVQWIWRNGYPIYINYVAMPFSNWEKRKWRPLTKLSEFIKKSGIQTCKLADSTLVNTPEPKVFPACDQGYLVSPHDRYEFPEILIATINNPIVYGGTNLIIVNGEVICHDLYDFRRDYTSEELHGRIQIDPKSGRIRWLLPDVAPEPITKAAAFVDACAPNYAHWMTEVLPRISMFCAEERFKDVPIVVNDGLHRNIMESLFWVVGDSREIITLPIGRALAVDELYLTSMAGYVPFERRTNKLSGHSHGMFSPLAFDILRNHINAMVQNTNEEVWPEKIFLRRGPGTRNFINTTEVENLMVTHGFVAVEPEKLTFSQQVQLFRNAKIIVGSSGAAFANIIFASQNAKILIFISKHPDTSYWYWQNVAAASGKNVSYILGKMNANDSNGIHADYIVDLDVLEPIIEREMNNNW